MNISPETIEELRGLLKSTKAMSSKELRDDLSMEEQKKGIQLIMSSVGHLGDILSILVNDIEELMTMAGVLKVTSRELQDVGMDKYLITLSDEAYKNLMAVSDAVPEEFIPKV